MPDFLEANDQIDALLGVPQGPPIAAVADQLGRAHAQAHAQQMPRGTPERDYLEASRAVDSLVGKPEWADDRIPLEARAADFAQSRGSIAARKLGAKSSEEEWYQTAKEAEQRFPGIDTDKLRQTYLSAQAGTKSLDQVEKAREYYKTQDPEKGFGGKLGFVAERAVPVASSVFQSGKTNAYHDALDRIKSGTARPEDANVVAKYEDQQKRESQYGLGKQIAAGVLHVPAILGEAALGGALLRGAGLAPALNLGARVAPVAEASIPRWLAQKGFGIASQTALMPSMYLPQSAQAAVQNGGNWNDLKNLGPAYAMGMMQVGVLGAASSVGQSAGAAAQFPSLAAYGARGAFSRLFASVATGMSGQQVVDLTNGIITQAVPEWGHKGFGLMGDLLDSKVSSDQFIHHAAVQAATFAAFGVAHAFQNPVGDAQMKAQYAEARQLQARTMQSFSDYLGAMKRSGASREAAGKEALEVHQWFMDRIKGEGAPKPDLTPQGEKYAADLGKTLDVEQLAKEQKVAQQALPPDVIDGMAKSNIPLESIPDPAVRAQVEARRNALAGKAPQIAQDATSPPEAAKGPTPAEAPAEAKLGSKAPEMTHEAAEALAQKVAAEPNDAAAKALMEGLRGYWRNKVMNRVNDLMNLPRPASVPLESKPPEAAPERWTRQEQQEAAKNLGLNQREFADWIRNNPKAAGDLEGAVVRQRNAPRGPQAIQPEPPVARQPTPLEPPAEANPLAEQQLTSRAAKGLKLAPGEEVGETAVGKSFRHAITDAEGNEVGSIVAADGKDTLNITVAQGKNIPVGAWRGLIKGLAEQYPDAKAVEFIRTTGPNAGKAQRIALPGRGRLGAAGPPADPFEALAKHGILKEAPKLTDTEGQPPATAPTPEAQEAEFRAAHPELTTPEEATAAVKAARRAVIDASKRGEDTTALNAQLKAALEARNAVASRIRQKKGGDQTLPPEMEASIKATDLTEQEKEAIIAKVTDSDSTRVLGEKLGVSRTTVLNRSKAALAKLQETDPDLWTDVNKRVEDLQTQALRQRAERQAADPRQELDHEDPVIQKDLEWDQPRLSKLSPEELAQELAETQRYLDDLAKPPDHANPEPAPVRPEDQPGLRGQAANPGAEVEAPGSPRDAAAEGQPPAPEGPPGGSGEARGDVVESRPVRDVGESRPEPTDPVMEAATEFAKQEGGFVTPEAILARAYDLAARLQATVRFVRNNWNEFAGNQFPRTARLSQNVAQKMVEWAHARTAALFGTPKYIDQIMGPLKAPAKTQLGRLGDAIRGQQVPQEARRMAGAIETQWRLDYMHDAYLKRSADLIAQAQKTPPGAEYARLTALAAEARKDAAGVGTIVGAKNSPLTSDAQYRAELAKPEHQEIQRLWEKHMVPEMEANFKKAMGMDPADAIDSFTQRPGHPINLKNLGPDEAMTSSAVTAIPRGQGRGNLGNVRQGRLGFSRQAKGTGTYDIDLGAIIANSLGKGIAGAARAEALKAMIAEEVAHPGEPFKPKEGYTEFKDTFPQKGNALAEEGQTSLYVKNESAGEYRQALQVDAAPKFPLIHGFNTALTRTALASSVEFVYHGKNLMTFLFKPGVRWLGDPTKGESPVFPDVLKNAYRVARNTPEAQAELFELARMGRMKTPGMESGLILPERFKSADPTYYASRILDGVQKVMRLTASEAFDRMSGEKPYWLADAVKELTGKHPFENTELNKTDFINQLGQYNKKSQNALVVLMRDLGIAPFATAGTNYYVQSMRGLTGAPGARTNSWAGEVAARGEVFAKMTAVLGAVGAANYLAWGRPDGDDKTPLGSVKVGSQGGKTQYLDLTALTGLTRGARQTGLLALAEGERAGGKKGKTTAEEDKAYGDIVTSLLHPFMGPGPQFLHTAITGKDSLGVDVTQPKMGDQSDMHRDLTAAAWQANPALSIIRPEIQRGLGSAISPKDREARKPLEERAQKLLGPFGIKTKK